MRAGGRRNPWVLPSWEEEKTMGAVLHGGRIDPWVLPCLRRGENHQCCTAWGLGEDRTHGCCPAWGQKRPMGAALHRGRCYSEYGQNGRRYPWVMLCMGIGQTHKCVFSWWTGEIHGCFTGVWGYEILALEYPVRYGWVQRAGPALLPFLALAPLGALLPNVLGDPGLDFSEPDSQQSDWRKDNNDMKRQKMLFITYSLLPRCHWPGILLLFGITEFIKSIRPVT